MVMKSALRSEKKHIHRQQILWAMLLWLLAIVSALSIIYSAHDTRNKFSELEVLRIQQDELQIEWGKYLLEESAWASYGRIEKVATEKLIMQVPTIGQVVMVSVSE
ncbi:MAG: cell division protein FtsL [Kiritimatiellia bacterium]|jgi:cell division protein FtsL